MDVENGAQAPSYEASGPAERLTPSLLTSGIKYREQVELVFPENSETPGKRVFVEIRPLRHGERALVQAIQARGFKVVNEGVGNVAPDKRHSAVTVDYELQVQAQSDALLKAAALGTVDTQWNENSLQAWPGEWVEKVGQRVLAISSVGTIEEQVNSFRDAGGEVVSGG